jgi:alpha-galactosidase
MLEVGNGGMSAAEYRSHFSLWCILAAPLMAGNDVRNMSPEIAGILMNKELIAVDQDPLGLQGRRVKRSGDQDVWAKQLADGGRAVALLNRGGAEAHMSISWSDIGYPNELSASVSDLWAKKDLGKLKSGFSAVVPSHGAVVIKVKP